jgi:hypothetical protein
MKKSFVTGLLMILLLMIIGCGTGEIGGNEKTAPASETTDTFTLLLTRDWAAEVLDTEMVRIEPEHNLLEYMQEEWQVTTGSGGGFIKGINGLGSVSKSGDSYDWFFYVNGEERHRKVPKKSSPRQGTPFIGITINGLLHPDI